MYGGGFRQGWLFGSIKGNCMYIAYCVFVPVNLYRYTYLYIWWYICPGNELHFHLEEDECNLLASCCIVAMGFFAPTSRRVEYRWRMCLLWYTTVSNYITIRAVYMFIAGLFLFYVNIIIMLKRKCVRCECIVLFFFFVCASSVRISASLDCESRKAFNYYSCVKRRCRVNVMYTIYD